MAAQEFSSPGEHMASMSSGSSQSNAIQVAERYPNAPHSNLSNVIYAPALSSYERDVFNDDVPVRGNRSRNSDIDDYLAAYTKYNESMYYNSRDWEKMMSDTSIRRQMEDLKAAGINPILAGRLGGAQWHSVNAPYTTINPGQAYSSMYSTDVNSQNVAAQIDKDFKIAELDRNNMLQIARESNLNSKEVAQLMSNYDVIQEAMRDGVTEAGDNKRLAGQIISAGIHGAVSLALIGSRGKHDGSDGSGGSGGSGSSSYGSPINPKMSNSEKVDAYNKWFAEQGFQDPAKYGFTNSLEYKIFNNTATDEEYATGLGAIATTVLLGIAALSGAPVPVPVP